MWIILVFPHAWPQLWFRSSEVASHAAGPGQFPSWGKTNVRKFGTYSSPGIIWRTAIVSDRRYCTIVFKKNGPPTNCKFQIHNIAHARLLEAPVHNMTQWNHVNMLYFEIKYVIEWNEGFIIAASMSLKIEITIKVIDTKFIETGYKIYRNKINKKST